MLNRQPKAYSIYAPAKLNLFLEVLGRRSDGYHDLETIITPISLCDRLRFEPTSDGRLRVTCRLGGRLRGQAAPPLDDQHNVAWRALERLRQTIGDPRLGGHLSIDKYIPWEAGLGGGSSDAAAALKLANRAWNRQLGPAALAEIGAAVGSDIPFFFADGTAVCRGRGERVTALPPHPPLWFVVVKPPGGLSTARAFSQIPADRTPRSAAEMLAVFQRPALHPIDVHLYSGLRESSSRLAPAIVPTLDALRATHPLGAEMSGSGTACFGLYRRPTDAARAGHILTARLPHALVFTCCSHPRSGGDGVQHCPSGV